MSSGAAAAAAASMDNHDLPLPSAFKIRFNTDDQDEWPLEAALLAATYSGDIRRLKEVATRLDVDGKGIASTLRHTSFAGMNVFQAAASGEGLLPMYQFLEDEVGMDVNDCDTASGMQVVVIPAKDSCKKSEEARKEELYRALSHHRTLLWHLYFSSIAFGVLLSFRPLDAKLSISVEMTIAFAVVTILYYGLVLHSSIWVTPQWVSGLDQWARGMGMWYFTACWMVFRTINIPSALYESRHMLITCFFLVLTLAIRLLSRVSRFAFLFGQGR